MLRGSGIGSRRALAACAAALALALPALAGAQTSGSTGLTGATGTTNAPCGAATTPTVAGVVGALAASIFHGELTGGEVITDAGRVTQSTALLSAVAALNRNAAYRAVHALVYHPLWHIVRLRVLDTSGRVLADVGGPYVIAPVTGELRLDGRVIGSYVMSVQDDYGFALLELHAAADPIAIYYNDKPVAWQGARFPRSAPGGSTLTVGHVTYTVVRESFDAFPSGTLTAVILVPPPNPSLQSQSCVAVKAAEIGRIAQVLASRFHPLNLSYQKFVETLHSDTGAVVIVRIGPRAIPGSQGLGPALIPLSGAVSYEGRQWWVFSFAPTPPARIYLLVPYPSSPQTPATPSS